ncbi:MAG: riboflavin synthase [bacterium]|nr:riboflavin synthase [bacterium]
MFTGIIQNLGKVAEKSKDKLKIMTDKRFISKLKKGTSIAVDGICLTAVNISSNTFEIDYTPETEGKTNIKYMETGDLVNLEVPTTPNTFLSGHIINGHIDGLGKVFSIREKGNSRIFKIFVPKYMDKYIVKKGSIAVNGVSLTIINVDDNSFEVSIIPYTWKNTMFTKLKKGDYVNIETDVLAKYVEKFVLNEVDYANKK